MTRRGQQGTGVADWPYLGGYLDDLRLPLLGCVTLAFLQGVRYPTEYLLGESN